MKSLFYYSKSNYFVYVKQCVSILGMIFLINTGEVNFFIEKQDLEKLKKIEAEKERSRNK